ncbi:hypothetical protein BDN71DRAFT_1454492 [Pleurotus eryngii]|uniref:Uncharacterized protein n=1 Tax=Pleurotus eryngii TaxID=5323 RepID=A0A9P5ZPD7_PLEER|nr:hypothetical protein BDN71DRAFT_1454492 [Pleurotus eryngii]
MPRVDAPPFVPLCPSESLCPFLLSHYRSVRICVVTSFKPSNLFALYSPPREPEFTGLLCVSLLIYAVLTGALATGSFNKSPQVGGRAK